MNSLRLVTLLLIALFTLAACDKQEEAATSAGAGDGPHNSLLSYVPTGTPYLGGNLAPTPNDVIDSFLKRFEPVAATAQAQLEKAKAQLEANPEVGDPAYNLGLAVLRELDGKLNRQGLESLGLDLQGQQVFYGMGIFPAVRVELGDAQALRATVQRVLDAAGMAEPQQEFQGVSYWQVTPEDDSSQSKLPLSFYIAILEDHMAFSVFPDSAKTELLPLFLGLEKPATSDAEARLKEVQNKYGYTPYFAAMADMSLVADELLNPGTLFVRSAGDSYTTELAALGDQCKIEFRQIIGHAPRLVAGSTELTSNAIGMQYVVETQPAEALQLIGLLAGVPMGGAPSTRLLEFAFGLKVGAVIDFLLAKATAITASPYQCAHLQDLNVQAANALTKLTEPLPPFVNNFRGLRLSLSQLSMSESIPDAVAGLLAVHVEQPELFVGMAQLFLPDMSALKLVKGEPPVPLPPGMIPMPDAVAFAAMTDTAIGISMGAGEESELLPYLDQAPAENGTFLAVNYNSAAYLDFTDKLADGLEDDLAPPPDDTAEPGTQRENPVKAVSDALRQAYADVVDRSQVDARFTTQGLLIDSRMTFK